MIIVEHLKPEQFFACKNVQAHVAQVVNILKLKSVFKYKKIVDKTDNEAKIESKSWCGYSGCVTVEELSIIIKQKSESLWSKKEDEKVKIEHQKMYSVVL